MAIAETNISTTVVDAVIGEGSDSVEELWSSANVNEWAKFKPANYGAGNNSYSDVDPLGRSTSLGVRLGDFRKYDHTANPPRYFLNPTNVSVPKYELFDELIDLLKGEMDETSTGDGFNPASWDKFDGSSNALLGVQLIIDSAPYGDVEDITDSSTMEMPISDLDSGSHNLNARYFDRGVYTEPWDARNLIEGGNVTLNINTTSALFGITAISLTPTTVGPKAPQEPISEDFTCNITFKNLTQAPYSRTMYWTFEDSSNNVRKSGSFGLSLAADETDDQDILFSDTFDDIGTYTFKTRVFSTSGEIVDDGTDTIEVWES